MKNAKHHGKFTVWCVAALVGGAYFFDRMENVNAASWATEITQVLNKVLLTKQLTEQEVHTAQLVKIDEQTMLSILSLPTSTHGMTEAAVDIARTALGSQGMPYETGSALGVHEDTFMFDSDAVLTQDTVMPVFGGFMNAQDQAAMESVASIAAQQEASAAARQAVDLAVDLSQGSLGQTQALMAGNQINAATFGKLDSIQTGIQSNNYLEARRVAAEQAEKRATYVQRNHDTRDFITGPYQSGVSDGTSHSPNVGAESPNGFLGM